MARPIVGPDLVDELEGNEEAKARLKTMLEQINGEVTVDEACAELGVARSTYFALRQRALSAAVIGLEPKPRGRPATRAETEEQERELAALKEQYEREFTELQMANLRQELRLILPEEVIGTPEYEASKKKQRNQRNQRKRQRRKQR